MAKQREETFSNYIPINRRFFKHPFWKEKRTFSKSEAWLYLMVEARFEESEVTELIGGKMVSWRRGEQPASIRYLAQAWNWDKNKVEAFLRMLEKERMVSRRLCNGQTIITLSNYEVYNPKKKGQQTGHPIPLQDGDTAETEDSKRDSDQKEKGQQTGQVEEPQASITEESKDSKRDTGGTATGQGQDKTNKVNKGNIEEGKKKEVVLASFERFQVWIKDNAPSVLKMQEQFTLEQYLELGTKISPPERIKELLISMHNYKPLLQKNKSAYLTILNWSKKPWNANTTENGKGPANEPEAALDRLLTQKKPSSD